MIWRHMIFEEEPVEQSSLFDLPSKREGDVDLSSGARDAET
jgi:hypothetical protein